MIRALAMFQQPHRQAGNLAAARCLHLGIAAYGLQPLIQQAFLIARRILNSKAEGISLLEMSIGKVRMARSAPSPAKGRAGVGY